MTEVKQNDDTFELYEDGQKAGFMEYIKKEDIIEIIHTEVDEKFGGKGLGRELVRAAVDYARKNDVKIVSSCPYAKKMIIKTPEFKDILGD